MFRIHLGSAPAFWKRRFTMPMNRVKSLFAWFMSSGRSSFRYVSVTYRSPSSKLFSMRRLVRRIFSRRFAFSISSGVGFLLFCRGIHAGRHPLMWCSQTSIPFFS